MKHFFKLLLLFGLSDNAEECPSSENNSESNNNKYEQNILSPIVRNTEMLRNNPAEDCDWFETGLTHRNRLILEI